MLGLRSTAPAFEAPPCMCDEIEARVRVACAMRDEMATWPTPLEEWRRLQAMPVLAPKGAVGQAQAQVVPKVYLPPEPPQDYLASPARCPHSMRRRELGSTVWRCLDCGAPVPPLVVG